MDDANGATKRGSAVGSSTERLSFTVCQCIAFDGVDGIADCRASRNTAAANAAADSNEAVRVRPHNQ